MSFVTHLECGSTGERLPADRLQTVSGAGKPLLVRYDLDRVAAAMTPDSLAARPPGMWRYRELLPLADEEEPISLGEAETPLVRLTRTEAALDAGPILVKDEGRMPTGTFKARGLALAVTLAARFGVTTIAMPTAGNAGAAMAAYASRAGIASVVLCPQDAPETTVREIAFHGARTWRVNGLINDCGVIVAEACRRHGWFDMSTLKEPYRIEGKKTMALELAEQLGWRAPDAIFYPTGGGTGLIGMWKGFQELQEIGLLQGPLPRMVCVQSQRCGPLVKAFDERKAEVETPWAPVTTTLHGVRVPKPFGDFLCLRALYESDGLATAVDDAEVDSLRADVARTDGVHLGPEGAACLAAYRMELARGRVGRRDRVVLFNCGSGLKSDLPPMDRRLDRSRPIDWDAL